MKQSDTVARFATPFAAQADSSLVTYPVAQTKPAPGRVSILDGFPIENFTALEAGGIPPSGADFNGLLRTLSEAIKANESGQIRPFDAQYAQQIGGYPKASLVSDPTAPATLYVSLKDDNMDDLSDVSSWANLNSALTTETQRAKKAEEDISSVLSEAQNALTSEQQAREAGDAGLAQSKVNRSGDTMSGPLSVSDTNGHSLTLGANSLQNEAGKSWQFEGDGSLTAPGGGILPEVLGVSGRVVIQAFSVLKPPGTDRLSVTFPVSYADGTTPIVISTNTTNPGANVNSWFDAAFACVMQDSNNVLSTNSRGFDYLSYGNNTRSSDQRSAAQIRYQFLALGTM